MNLKKIVFCTINIQNYTWSWAYYAPWFLQIKRKFAHLLRLFFKSLLKNCGTSFNSFLIIEIIRVDIILPQHSIFQHLLYIVHLNVLMISWSEDFFVIDENELGRLVRRVYEGSDVFFEFWVFYDIYMIQWRVVGLSESKVDMREIF